MGWNRIGLLALLMSVSGCSWLMGEQGFFPDKSDAYRDARPVPALKVPEDLDNTALQEIYVIPPTRDTISASGEFEVPRPAPLVRSSADQLVRIQRLGREEWILVSLNPGQLWPQVRAFLSSGNRPVARVEARAGLIETAWLPSTDGGMEERYRFRMEQGVQRNTAELHVLQMFRAGDVTSWPEISSDLEREKVMLRDMAQFIANNAGSAPVSMMAQQSLTDGGKLSMQDDKDGEPYIRLVLPYNRAFASLERALTQSSFAVEDKNSSEGIYHVRFVPPANDEKGWFDWLFGGDEVDHGEFGKQVYVLRLEKISEDTQRITVGLPDQTPLDPALAQKLLSLVKGNIN